MANKSILRRYNYLWVTLAFFLISIIGHWIFAWESYVSQQEEYGQSVEIAGYVNETLRDTFENWQSEFLQLMWQVGGLAILLHVGSPQSKEDDERKEAKLDLILEKLDSKGSKKEIAALDRKFMRS